MLVLFLTLLFFAPLMWWISDRFLTPIKPKKVESVLGKTTPAIAYANNTPIDELEEWWEANKSKDARIKALEATIRALEVENLQLMRNQYSDFPSDRYLDFIRGH